MLLLATGGRGALAEDIVHLVPSGGGEGKPRLTGEVLDYTGRELRIRLPSGVERKLPASRVSRVTTPLAADHFAGDALFAKHDYQQALEKYQRALNAGVERRDWVRRQIMSQIVWCLRALGETEQAAEAFLSLLRRDPATQDFDCIPLAWQPSRPSPRLEQLAKAWLQGDDPVAALLGAGYLLSTPERSAAVARLNKLASDPDRRVAALAQAQLWRTTAFSTRPEDLLDNLRAIEKMPEDLRAGPYFVVGGALAVERPLEAALALLRVPVLYPRERRLAASALLLAGNCLDKGGQPAEAARLYQELTSDFAGTAEAGEAAERLKQAARSQEGGDDGSK